ncbi:MAG: lytic transglycosylase [Rhodobacteraceae bacterium]|nr:lytic transglycosylase [Paracoccaceae bacterium]
MKPSFLAGILLLLVLVSCSSGHKVPPRNLDNACSILSQKPKYLKAFRAAERKWGVPIHVQMATIYQESRFDRNARTPHRYVLGVIPIGRQSSAYGYAQVLDGTWDEYRKSTGRSGAKRTRIRDASDFMGWYMNLSRSRNGIALDDARNQYLAYHEGHAGYARGSYRNKSWLLRVSSQVDARADRYKRQLSSCRKLHR